MSTRQTLAEQGAGLCAWGLGAVGLATGAPLLAPVAVTGALIWDHISGKPKRKARAAVKRATTALEVAGIPDRGITAALQLLRERQHDIHIDLSDLKDGARRNAFPDTLYDTVFGDVGVPQDDRVEEALRIVIAEAFEELRLDPAFDTVFQQESLKAIETAQAAGFARITALLSKADEERALILSFITHGQIDMAEQLADMQDSFASLKADYGTLAQSLNDLRNLKRRDLDYLALKFGLSLPATAKDDMIVAELATAADNLRARSAQSEAMTAPAQLADLKTEAEAARADLDFIAADRLLAEIAAVERDIAQEAQARAAAAREVATEALTNFADTMAARGANALDSNKPKDAFDHLAEAADTFRESDLLQYVARREKYSQILYLHGRRFPGGSYILSIAMIRPAIEAVETTGEDDLLATCKETLAVTLAELGDRLQGPGAESALTEAISLFQWCLAIRTESDNPARRAKNSMQLGNALVALGKQQIDTNQTEHFETAIAAYSDALDYFTLVNSPLDWALTKKNLGQAYALSARQLDGQPNDAMLQRAENKLEEALTVFTVDQHPISCADCLTNLGGAIFERGIGQDSVQLISHGIEQSKRALKIYEDEKSPNFIAIASYNIAYSLLELARRDRPNICHVHLMQALEHINSALQIFEPSNPRLFNNATELRDRIHTALADLP